MDRRTDMCKYRAAIAAKNLINAIAWVFLVSRIHWINPHPVDKKVNKKFGWGQWGLPIDNWSWLSCVYKWNPSRFVSFCCLIIFVQKYCQTIVTSWELGRAGSNDKGLFISISDWINVALCTRELSLQHLKSLLLTNSLFITQFFIKSYRMHLHKFEIAYISSW